jgi:hypothetical protein
MTARSRDVSIVLLLFLGMVCLHPAAAAAEQGPRIPSVVPREVATGLAGLQGRMDPQQMLRLTLVLQPPRQEELQRVIDEVNAPNSPRFHRFLTFDEWKARFAPSAATVDTVDAWARSQGLAVIHRFRDNLALKVEGSAAMVESAFDLQLNHYTLGGRRFFSADRGWRGSFLVSTLRGVKSLMVWGCHRDQVADAVIEADRPHGKAACAETCLLRLERGKGCKALPVATL